MKIDCITFIQGVHNARDKGHLSKESHDLIQDELYPLMKNDRWCSRTYIDYTDLLVALSKINLGWLEAASLWEFLGKSMAEGLSVGSQL